MQNEHAHLRIIIISFVRCMMHHSHSLSLSFKFQVSSFKLTLIEKYVHVLLVLHHRSNDYYYYKVLDLT
jgi:hypothetical protein